MGPSIHRNILGSPVILHYFYSFFPFSPKLKFVHPAKMFSPRFNNVFPRKFCTLNKVLPSARENNSSCFFLTSAQVFLFPVAMGRGKRVKIERAPRPGGCMCRTDSLGGQQIVGTGHLINQRQNRRFRFRYKRYYSLQKSFAFQAAV